MSEAIAVAAFTHCLAPNVLPRSETAREPKCLTLSNHLASYANAFIDTSTLEQKTDSESLSQWRMPHRRNTVFVHMQPREES